MPQPIVYINGWPGVGKLTVARELGAKLGAGRTRLVHNHLLIDPAGAVLPRSSAGYQPLRRALRAAVFGSLATAPDTFDFIYVFTDFQSSDGLGSAVAQEYADAARARGCVFVPIIMTCSVRQNVIRAGGSDRIRDGHGKLTDLNLIMDMRTQEGTGIASFGGDSELELDVTDIKPEEAAKIIAEHVEKIVAAAGEKTAE